MNEEEKKAIENLKEFRKNGYFMLMYKYNDRIKVNRIIENSIDINLNYISKLQKELEQEKEKNKKLNLENQALFESINCNDDNMLARRYSNLQKELDKKDKVINLMAEYLNENNREFWTDDIEETKQYFYKKVEEENE